MPLSECRVAVAYSGGRDSTALLHATLAAAEESGLQVIALHVHHGLSPHADAWLAHCAARCRRWARAGRPIEFVADRLDDRPAQGESVEAWARAARYRSLQAMASASRASIVLLAHHRRDQAETLLLQALRGAGTAGLSGMPRSVERGGVTWLRPWLATPGDAIGAYVKRHRLRHVEDDSNADPRFARNRLRLQVWPQLADAFPQAEASLAAAATWAQQAEALLDEVAAGDLERVVDGDALCVAAWQTLSVPRRTHALRLWLRRRCGAPAPASIVLRLLDELPHGRSASWPLTPGELRIHRGRLRWVDALVPMPNPTLVAAATGRETQLSVRAPGRFALPGWAGALEVSAAVAGGVPLARLARLELRARVGGERFQFGPGRPPRSLKKQYQASGLSGRERGGPLLYSAGQLVFVPGLGLDARVVDAADETRMTLAWLPAAPAGRARALPHAD